MQFHPMRLNAGRLICRENLAPIAKLDQELHDKMLAAQNHNSRELMLSTLASLARALKNAESQGPHALSSDADLISLCDKYSAALSSTVKQSIEGVIPAKSLNFAIPHICSALEYAMLRNRRFLAGDAADYDEAPAIVRCLSRYDGVLADRIWLSMADPKQGLLDANVPRIARVVLEATGQRQPMNPDSLDILRRHSSELTQVCNRALHDDADTPLSEAVEPLVRLFEELGKQKGVEGDRRCKEARDKDLCAGLMRELNSTDGGAEFFTARLALAAILGKVPARVLAPLVQKGVTQAALNSGAPADAALARESASAGAVRGPYVTGHFLAVLSRAKGVFTPAETLFFIHLANKFAGTGAL